MDLSDWIDRNARLHPEKTAIRFPGRDLDYRQFADLVARLAGALAASGVGTGRAVAYLGFNSPEMLALLFASARLGALFMPLNWRLAAPEHLQMLRDCPPQVLIVEPQYLAQTDPLRGELFRQDPAATARRLPVCVTTGTAADGWTGWNDFLDGATPLAAATDPAVGAASPLLICYTSGSTGKPKGVLLTQDALAWNAENSTDMHDLRAEDVVLTTLPLFHVGGLNNQTTPALKAGCTLLLHPKFDPDATFDAIERERVTLTTLVPAQLDMMMASPRWQTADLTSLRMISTGSTIVADKLIRAVNGRGVPLVQIYGATETCPIAACQKAEDAERKAGSAGRPARHCELRIVDAAGHEVPAGVTGDILVRGPNVMSGYWNAPEATAAVLVDGWFHTGDMGHRDAEGYLWVDGRRKEMIISGGENIYPAEIENLLIECPDIAEVAVIGRPDERWGELVVAVVAPKPGRTVSPAQVIALLEGRIARFKHPKAVMVVGELPKSALGKVRKEDVRQMVAQGKLGEPA